MRIITTILIGIITLLSATSTSAQDSNIPTVTLTDDNANKIISSGKPVVIDFWASWCKPCLNMSPIIEKVAKKYSGKVIIGKYNVEDGGEFVSQHRIMAIPTLLFFKNGKKTEIHLVGFQEQKILEEKIEELLAL